jgi:hypothetical protein
MAKKKLKQLLGDGGAGLDKSHGTDRLYDLLEALITQVNDQATQFNQLKADFDASSTPTSASDVTSLVEVE